MVKKLVSIIFLALLGLFTAPYVVGATSLASHTAPNPPRLSSYQSVRVKIVVSKDKHKVTLYFSNLQNVATLTYTLTYNSSGGMRGVIGTITPNGASRATREIILGTCSRNVCVYDTNIANMQLLVEGQYIGGRTFSQTYDIKI